MRIRPASPIKLLLSRNIRGSVLDVGCGGGSEAFRISRSRCDHSLGCEIDPRRVMEARMHYDNVIQCDARQLPIRAKTFDSVLAFEVIEHVKFPQALNLLENLETISRDTVIVSTPTALARPIGPRKRATREDNWQSHQCIIAPRILKMRGYSVHGTKVGLRNKWLQRMLKPIAYLIYSFATGIMAVKHVSATRASEDD